MELRPTFEFVGPTTVIARTVLYVSLVEELTQRLIEGGAPSFTFFCFCRCVHISDSRCLQPLGSVECSVTVRMKRAQLP